MPDDPVEIDRATGAFMTTTKKLVNFYNDMEQNNCNNMISKLNKMFQVVIRLTGVGHKDIMDTTVSYITTFL